MKRKKILTLFIIAGFTFGVYFFTRPVAPLKELTSPTGVAINFDKFILDSLPLPIIIKLMDGLKVELKSIRNISAKEKELRVEYNTIIYKKDDDKKNVTIVLEYTFYISDNLLFLSGIRIRPPEKSVNELRELQINEEFIVGTIEEHWRRISFQIPQELNEIVELSPNEIILK